jgi:hypothetical protein
MEDVRCPEHYWLVEPLLDAGMPLEEVRTLVVRLACEEGGVLSLVADQPPRVQAAWHETIGRMIAQDNPAG